MEASYGSLNAIKDIEDQQMIEFAMMLLCKKLLRSPTYLTVPYKINVNRIFKPKHLIERNLIPAFNNDTTDLIKNNSLLLQTFPQNPLLSGLITLTEIEKRLLYESSDVGKEFRQYLYTLCAKVLFHYNKTIYPTLENYLQNGIKNTFGSIPEFKISKQLEPIVQERILPFIQHFATYISGNTSFSFETLENICGPYVIRESYRNSNIKIISFIELMHLKYFQQLIPFTPKQNFIYHMINPPGFGYMKTYFNELDSIQQTHQKHCDIMIIKNDINENHKLYYDIKTYVTLGVDKCRFSLFHSNKKNILKYMNDLRISLKQFITTHNLDEKHSLTTLFININDIKKNSKATLQEINNAYISMIQLLVNYIISNRDTNLRLGVAIPSQNDPFFNGFFEEVLKIRLPELENDVQLLKKFFPKSSLIPEKERIEHIEKVIKTIFPDHTQKELLDTLYQWQIKLLTL